MGSWAKFRWEGRGGEPGSSGTSGGLQGRPRKQHSPGSGRWALSGHGWTSKGARVCSGQWPQDRVLSDPPTTQMDTTWARLVVQKWKTGFAFHSALISSCVFHRGARVLTPMAAGTPKCPPEALASLSQTRQVPHRHQGGSLGLASASPGPGAGPSQWPRRRADPVTFPRPPQCAQPLAPPSPGTQKGGMRQGQSG